MQRQGFYELVKSKKTLKQMVNEHSTKILNQTNTLRETLTEQSKKHVPQKGRKVGSTKEHTDRQTHKITLPKRVKCLNPAQTSILLTTHNPVCHTKTEVC